MKILITGSHFTPAQATIEQLRKMQPDIKVVYVGRRYTREGDKAPSLESEVLPRLGVKFINLVTGRLQRTFTIYTIPSLFKLPIGFLQAFYILVKEKPDVVLSFGGYIAMPVVLVAWLLSIPIIIHEQTLVSGLASRITSYFADKIAVSFDNIKCPFPSKKVVFTGNPIRAGILSEGSKAKLWGRGGTNKNLPLVFITGGNQGSHLINTVISQIIPDLTKFTRVIHQTGDSKFFDFDSLKSLETDNYHVVKFLSADEIGWCLKNASVVICRAGINTLLELAYFKTPAIVIPIRNHPEQQLNAKYFQNLGLITTISESKLSAIALLKQLKLMSGNLRKLKQRAAQLRQIVIADAAKRLALETILLA